MALCPIIKQGIFLKNYINFIVSKMHLPYHPQFWYARGSSKDMMSIEALLHVKMFHVRVKCREYGSGEKSSVYTWSFCSYTISTNISFPFILAEQQKAITLY